jgi:hypothetical protein
MFDFFCGSGRKVSKRKLKRVFFLFFFFDFIDRFNTEREKNVNSNFIFESLISLLPCLASIHLALPCQYFFSCVEILLSTNMIQQGILKGEVSLYH